MASVLKRLKNWSIDFDSEKAFSLVGGLGDRDNLLPGCRFQMTPPRTLLPPTKELTPSLGDDTVEGGRECPTGAGELDRRVSLVLDRRSRGLEAGFELLPLFMVLVRRAKKSSMSTEIGGTLIEDMGGGETTVLAG